MKYTIRQFRDEDFDSVLEITLSAFRPIHESFRRILGRRIFRLVYPDWRASYRRYLKSLCHGKDRKNILVIETGGVVVGFISFFLNSKKRSGELGLNAILPGYQSKGLGSRMYGHVLCTMKKKGIRVVDVHTGGDESHAVARRAYEKAGFTALPLVRYYKAL
jgi:GNAT superfamily N-acetyltransferase